MGPLERGFLRACRSGLCSQLEGQVVEIGAGTGLNFTYYPPACQVLALEPHPGMRRCAEKRLQSHGLFHIRLSPAGGEQIPLDTASVDHCVSTLVLCSVAEVAPVLREIRRVLKPGGQLHLLEHSRGQGGWGRLHDALTPLWSRLSGGCHLNRRPREAILQAGLGLNSWVEVARLAGMEFATGQATAPPSSSYRVGPTPGS